MILLITMGGTIDAAAFREGRPAPKVSTPTHAHLVQKAIESMAGIASKTIALCNKDSKELTEDDRLRLFEIIKGAKDYERIIVTVGTDRMGDIARMLQIKVPRLACPVVFTGAFLPLANGAKSDGFENLRSAVRDKPDLAPGVYIVMSGLFGDAAHIYKDFDRNIFVVHH